MRRPGARPRRSIPATAGALALAVVLALPAQAGAASVEELAPVSPWVVNRSLQNCTLSRAFDNKKTPFLLYFQRFAPGDLFQMVLSSRKLRSLVPPHKLWIEYGKGGYVDEVRRYMPGKTRDGTPTILILNSALAAPGEDRTATYWIPREQEAAIDRISFTRTAGKALVLKTGSLGEPFAALRKCTDDLVASWGLDPVRQSRLSRPATPSDSPDEWLRSADYPPAALRGRKQAVVNFILMVDAHGKPTRCTIQRSYSGGLFDDVSCELLMRRASFAPALDAEGNPVASYYRDTIRWIIP